MPRAVLGLCLLLSLALATPVVAGTTTILECRFDTEPLDTLIGQGGAAAGQPVTHAGAPAYVRAAPMATPSLEIGDDSAITTELVRFEFVDDQSVTTGTLTISVNLWFHSPEYFHFYVREPVHSTVRFLNLIFHENGVVQYGDIDTSGNITIGSYTAGSILPLTVTFDLDAKTYDVVLNGVALRTAESMGVFTQGIGSVSIGAGFDSDSDGLLSVDDLVVTATEAPSPVESQGWARVKAGWRSE